MRDQYVGDVSDVLKFAFLRALAATDRTLGVAWYYVPGDDGRADGRHLEWRDEPAWQRLDVQLHAGLSTLPERSIAALERAAIWPNTTLFHRDRIPQRPQRSAWGVQMRGALDGADIVFLDPDTGLSPPEDEKHVTPSEIRILQRPGRAIVFITFPGRIAHDMLVQRLHERLVIEARATTVVTLRTNVSVPRTEGSRSTVPRPCWFTIVNPDATLIARAHTFADALALVPRVRARLDGRT